MRTRYGAQNLSMWEGRDFTTWVANPPEAYRADLATILEDLKRVGRGPSNVIVGWDDAQLEVLIETVGKSHFYHWSATA